MTRFEQMILLHVPADYDWSDEAALRPVWEKDDGLALADERELSFPTEMRLPQVKVPALVIHGTSDRVVPFVQGKAVYDAIPVWRKRFVSVKGADHCNFQFFLGERYVPLLVGFLQKGESLFTYLIWKLHVCLQKGVRER